MQEHEQEEHLEDRLRSFLESLPQDIRVVAWMWDAGKSPVEIAEAIGKSVKAVYRHHRAFQKELVKRCLVGGAALDEKRLREVVDDLSGLAFVA